MGFKISFNSCSSIIIFKSDLILTDRIVIILLTWIQFFFVAAKILDIIKAEHLGSFGRVELSKALKQVRIQMVHQEDIQWIESTKFFWLHLCYILKNFIPDLKLCCCIFHTLSFFPTKTFVVLGEQGQRSLGNEQV